MTGKQYTIGQMAKICSMTAEQLRHYDKNHVLSPNGRGRDNDYSYYTEEKIEDLLLIKELKKVGLSLRSIAELLQKFPYELSGGQKQRVAVARALITQPKLVLADEPTGALDSRATDELLRLFEDVNRGGQTILMVTHSVKAASHASRVLFIKDGEVFHEIYRGESTDEQLYQKISDTLTMLATGGEHHA